MNILDVLTTYFLLSKQDNVINHFEHFVLRHMNSNQWVNPQISDSAELVSMVQGLHKEDLQ